jgi:hypothetical protein
MDDVTGSPGSIPALVRVTGGDELTSLNVAIGTSLASGNPSSELVISSFDALAPADSIWAGKPVNSSASPPGLPNAFAKLNNSIASADVTAIGNGSVFEVIFDASGTQPGDIFDIDLNFANLTSAANGATILTGDLIFEAGKVTIEASPLQPGDFNQDGVLDAADIDSLTSAVKESSTDLSFDLDNNGAVEAEDRRVWVEDLRRTYFGDSNLDLEFDSGDFVAVFQAGQYEDLEAENSTWATGDWNGDCEFDSGDFVLAFQSGGYENGPRLAVVPEPVQTIPLLGILLFGIRRRRRPAMHVD